MSAPANQQTAIAKISNVLTAPAMRAAFSKVLPPSMAVDSYIQSVVNAVAIDPKLAECTARSIALAAVTSASLGLAVGPLQEAYLVPYSKNIGTKDRPQWIKECQFQPGYRGWIKMSMDNGQVLKVDARCVYSNEKFDVYFGSNERIEHIPNFIDPGHFVAVYAIAKLANGEEKFIVLPKKRIDELRSRSKTSTAWDRDFDEMAKAKSIRQLCKTIPMGRMTLAAEIDSRVEQGESYRDVIDIDAEVFPVNGHTEAKQQQPEPGAIDAELELTEEEKAAEEALYKAQSEVVDMYEALKTVNQCGPMKAIESMSLEQLEGYYNELRALYTAKMGVKKGK